MTAAVEPKLGALAVETARHVIKPVARHRIGDHHVALAVGDQEAKAQRERQKLAQIFGDAYPRGLNYLS